MRFRMFLLGLASLMLAIFYSGCSTSEEGSFNSAWTSLSAKGGTTDVVTATPTAEIKISVLPAQLTVANDNKIPVSVSLIGSTTTGVNMTVAMSSTLGGVFNPESGSFDNGNFMTSFTAPSSLTGTTELVALTGSFIGTCAVQILPKAAVTYQVQVVPASLTLGQQQTTPLTVRVTDSNGSGVDGSDVTLTSSLEGTFGSTTGRTQKGVFTTTFTSGSVGGNCTLTAAAEGVNGSAVVVVTVMPSITIVPALNPVVNGKTQVVSVKIADERGNPLKDVKAYIFSSAGGSFNVSSSETDAAGLAYFEYTAPSPAPLAGTDTITVQALGLNSAASIVIQ